jgi:lysozyme family protein
MKVGFSDLKDGYTQDLIDAKLTRGQDIVRQARHLVSLKERYEAVTKATGVPVAWLLCIDYRESDNDAHTYLGNGQPIIGRGRRTTEVPRNRGPFETWEDGAIDSLRYMALVTPNVTWSLLYAIWEAERWNGFGPRFRGKPSGYLWAGTSIYQGGKFVADGRWDPEKNDKELGVVPLLQMLAHLDPELAISEQETAHV